MSWNTYQRKKVQRLLQTNSRCYPRKYSFLNDKKVESKIFRSCQYLHQEEVVISSADNSFFGYVCKSREWIGRPNQNFYLPLEDLILQRKVDISREISSAGPGPQKESLCHPRLIFRCKSVDSSTFDPSWPRLCRLSQRTNSSGLFPILSNRSPFSI